MPPGQSAARTSKAPGTNRHEFGSFWLWHRADRDDWGICWYENGSDGNGRRTCRKSLGIDDGINGEPPKAAQDALAKHYLGSQKPVQAPNAEIYVEKLMADWLLEHAAPNLSDPGRYANGVTHWIAFFQHERTGGRPLGQPTVSDITSALVKRFHAWRRLQGVGGHTISRNTAALRQPLNWAWKHNLIASVPFIPDVKSKSEPRKLVYTIAQIAALLEA
jgi:hypothetical protein